MSKSLCYETGWTQTSRNNHSLDIQRGILQNELRALHSLPLALLQGVDDDDSPIYDETHVINDMSASPTMSGNEAPIHAVIVRSECPSPLIVINQTVCQCYGSPPVTMQAK